MEVREPSLEAGLEERPNRILEEFSTTVLFGKITIVPQSEDPLGKL